jgi:phytoene/squalene synthetase
VPRELRQRVHVRKHRRDVHDLLDRVLRRRHHHVHGVRQQLRGLHRRQRRGLLVLDRVHPRLRRHLVPDVPGQLRDVRYRGQRRDVHDLLDRVLRRRHRHVHGVPHGHVRLRQRHGCRELLDQLHHLRHFRH